MRLRNIFIAALLVTIFGFSAPYSLSAQWAGRTPSVSMPSVKHIKITSAEGGSYSEFIVEKRQGRYFAKNGVVPSERISQLLAAVGAPSIHKPSLANIGVTQEWLNANAEKGVRDYAAAYYEMAAPNQKALYLSSFKDPKFIEKVLPLIIHARWTDDYPEVTVEIEENTRTRIRLSTEAQPLFMLPWAVSRNGETAKTYNADISRAIANLVPDKFPNRERLAGKGFEEVLAKTVLRQIEDRWNLIDAENKAGGVLSRLRASYTVESAEINGYHSVDYGGEWVNGNPTEENLHAILRRPKFPKNFSIELVLPFREGRVENVDLFLGAMDRYKNLALSVPWLKNDLAAHPEMYFQISFVHDRSFGEKAMKVFTVDMRLGHKEALVKEIEAVQKEVTLVVTGERTYDAYWLVLPDKRMVLWRFIWHQEVRNWKSKKIPHWECGSYQGDCAGVMVSPDGEIISK